MKYRVVVAFKDLQDSNHQYFVGDTYPRNGAETNPARIAELSSKDNRAGLVLIEQVKEAKAEPKVEEVVAEEPKAVTGFAYTKAEIMRMSVAKLRTIAEELELDSSLSGAKLKPLIIEKLGL